MTSIDWSLVSATVWPLAVALLIGFVVRRLVLLAAKRARGRAGGRAWALIIAAVAVPAAFALPLFFLSLAVNATPLPALWIARIQHLLGVGGLACLTWAFMRAVGAMEARIVARNPVDVADNLHARRVQTQTRVIGRAIQIAILLFGLSIILMTFPAIRQVGATLLASAGLVGVVAGFAAKPVFGNLIAGLQIAITQPIRLDDVVIVDGEWGRIEEITSAYVVVAIWDQRRLVVPLQWFIENPFQNWTRRSAEILGPVFLWLDHGAPLEAVRAELRRICESDPRWDGRVCVVHVEDIAAEAMKVRLLVSARNSGDDYDLRAAVRERMLDYLRREQPQALPRMRATLDGAFALQGAQREPRTPEAASSS
ncbi:mechanosensitive ion channel domain-containing protein [Luteimonas huabeiensis]|uniref:mechanosensitive ion channel domain-containing protein n=1 Tax=Luteimonas huabeiensis TaxID=1244513 RepID=UPI000466F2F9|nr:mechanosensitive ion channel domain-containing protein [Luteimonas huabeiensis]